MIFVVFRASEAVKQMELSQKHEAEESAALEKMMQKVEANLEVTMVMIMTSCGGPSLICMCGNASAS